MGSSNEKIFISVKKETVWLAGLFVVGFITRIIYMQQNQLNPMYVFQSSYLEPPPNWFSPAALWRSPVFLYFARAVFNIFVHSYFMLKLSFFAIGSVNLLLIYALSKKIFNTAVARIASLIALVYIPFIFYEGDLFEPPFAIFLGIIFFLLVLNAFEKPSKRLWFVCGIFWALALLARHHFFLFGVVVVIYLITDFFKNKDNKAIVTYIICMLSGLILIISPITLRNIIVGKDFVLIGYVEGISFWHGNNPDYEKLWDRAAGFGWEEILQMPFQEMKLSRPLKPSDMSRFFTHQALKFIREHPFEWLKLTAKKTCIFFSGYETMSDSDIYSYREYSPLVAMLVGEKWILYPFGIVCPLAIIGVALSARNNRKASLLTAMIISASYLDILLAVQSRYRTATVPFFIIAAAYALWWYKNTVKSGQKRALLVSAASFVILVFLCNMYNPEMSDVNKARIYYKKAHGYLMMKDTVKAIAEVKKAIAVYPENPSSRLHLTLADLYKRQKEMDKAASEYESAVLKDPKNARTHIDLARIFELKNEIDKAIVEYKKAIALPLSPDNQMSTHFQLGRLYKKKMFYNDAVKEFQFLISHQGLAKYQKPVGLSYINLAEIYEISGKKDSAISMYEQALRLDPENSLLKNKIETLRQGKTPNSLDTLPSPAISSN